MRFPLQGAVHLETSYICLYAQIPFVFKGFSAVVDDAVWNGRIFSRFLTQKQWSRQPCD